MQNSNQLLHKRREAAELQRIIKSQKDAVAKSLRTLEELTEELERAIPGMETQKKIVQNAAR